MAIHRLTSSDSWFVGMHRRDPLTHSDFRFGDHVVVCSHCRSVQLEESWEFNRNQCCICGGDEQKDSFERSFIDYDYPGENTVSGLQETHSQEYFDRIGEVLDRLHAYNIGRIFGIMIWTLTILLAVTGSGLLLKSDQSMAEHLAEHRDMMIAHTEEKIEEIRIGAEDKVNTKLIPLIKKTLDFLENVEDKLLKQSGKVVSKAAQKAEEISEKGKMLADTVWDMAYRINEWFWSLINQIGALVGTAA